MNSSVREGPVSAATSVTISSEPWGVAALQAELQKRRDCQRENAPRRDRWIARNRYYYQMISRLLQFIIEPGKRVLNIRCQTGFFLEAVKPSAGVGIDLTTEMVDQAKAKYPWHDFRAVEGEDFKVEGVFDYILINDLTDTVDILAVLRSIQRNCTARTRIIVYSFNPMWGPLLELGEKTGLRMPQPESNWISETDARNLLEVSGFEPLKTFWTSLCPFWIPLISTFLNRFVGRLPVLERLSMAYMLVARPVAQPVPKETITVTVVIPCRNERDNIAPAVERVPGLAGHTEILFCDDKSTDGTADEVRRMQQLYPEKDIRLIEGPGICKAENVWTGFREAKGDMLLILDGDLTVMPEELPYFVDLMLTGRVEFANGSRLVYPMQRQAMKWTNFVGNKVFATIFTYLMGQRVKDTLCGTKVLWKSDWQRIEPLLGSWGVNDRWGDYELLLGAAKRHLRVVDVAVHYQNRVFGVSKMTRVFANGWNMLRICIAAFRRLKMGY